MKIKDEGVCTFETIRNFLQFIALVRYQSTYLEMKYHLKRVLDGQEDNYFKSIYHHDRNIGKSAALARLSVKYDIPVVVPTQTWKITIEKDIPNYLPKYFKKKTSNYDCCK